MSTSDSATLPDRYRCPGEPYTISRAEHLGRLAAFYEKCRDCPHRQDAVTLAPRRRKQWAAVAARQAGSLQFGPESISGVLLNELSAQAAENLAARFGIVLRGARFTDRSAPILPVAVFLAYDGRPEALELLTPLARGLRWAACQVQHLGAASVGRLAAAVADEPNAAAVYLGNDRAHHATASLRFWGPGFVPCSSPGSLDLLRDADVVRGDRPTRHAGGQSRQSSGDRYLGGLRPRIATGRALRMVCDIRSAAVARDLAELIDPTPCQITHSSVPKRNHRNRAASLTRARIAGASKPSAEWFAPRTADVGVVIDDDCEALHVFDELSRPVDPDALLCLFARSLSGESGSRLVLTETEPAPGVVVALAHAGCAHRTLSTEDEPPTRQAVHEAQQKLRPGLIGGPSGRYRFAGAAPAADALVTLVELLAVLGADERPLSARIKAALVRLPAAG